MADFFRDYGAQFAWLIAAVGWWISHRQASFVEKRKEIRAEISEIELTTKSITKKFCEYHRLTAGSAERKIIEIDIKILFKELAMRWERLSKRRFKIISSIELNSCIGNHETFYDHATGKYFESKERQSQEEVQQHLQQISSNAFAFVDACHNLFIAEYDGLK